jgi:hypothetical protein
VQEEGSLPSERSGEGGAQRRSAQAKRGRLGCLLGAPEAEPQEGLVSRILTLLCFVSLASAGLGSPSKSSTGVNVLLPHVCDGHGDSPDLVVGYFSGRKLG